METMQGLQNTKIALLIDFDNVILGVEDPGFDVELVVNTLRSRGVVVMGRAYGDWYRHHRHRRKLMEQGIELVETPVFGPLIKNSADIRIVIDGLDIAAAHSHIDTFCLVSGDSDFLPLIKRLQLLGKHVIVIAGIKFTSDLVRRNCNEYLAYENLLAESVGATEDASTLEGSFHLLERAINTLIERGMDIRSSAVKQMMLQLNPAFSERTFGCYQFKQFLDKAARADVVSVSERSGASGEHDVMLSERIVAMAQETSLKSSTQLDAFVRDSPRERRAAPARGGRGRNRTQETPNNDAKTPDAAPLPKAENVPASLETPRVTNGKTGAKSSDIAPISSSALAARPGLRRGRLRFSAKIGGTTFEPQNADDVKVEGAKSSTRSEDDAANEVSVDTALDSAIDEVLVAEIAGSSAPNEVANADANAENDGESAVATSKRRGTRGGRRRRGTKTEGEIKTEGDTNAADFAATHASGADAAEIPLESAALQNALLENASSPVVIIAPANERTANFAENASATSDNSSSADAQIAMPETPAEPKKRTSRGRRGGAKKTGASSASATPNSAIPKNDVTKAGTPQAGTAQTEMPIDATQSGVASMVSSEPQAKAIPTKTAKAPRARLRKSATPKTATSGAAPRVGETESAS